MPKAHPQAQPSLVGRLTELPSPQNLYASRWHVGPADRNQSLREFIFMTQIVLMTSDPAACAALFNCPQKPHCCLPPPHILSSKDSTCSLALTGRALSMPALIQPQSPLSGWPCLTHSPLMGRAKVGSQSTRNIFGHLQKIFSNESEIVFHNIVST